LAVLSLFVIKIDSCSIILHKLISLHLPPAAAHICAHSPGSLLLQVSSLSQYGDTMAMQDAHEMRADTRNAAALPDNDVTTGFFGIAATGSRGTQFTNCACSRRRMLIFAGR